MKIAMPLISIIVPVYNVEEYLTDCVESILKQSYKNFQVILVNDGSTDRSGLLCDRYAEGDNRIKVIHKKNGGLSDARNVGLNIAEGDYIVFTDSDDFLHRDYLKVQYENLVQTDADMAVCDYHMYDTGQYVEDSLSNRISTVEKRDITAQLYENSGMLIVAWNKLYRRFLWDEIRYPVGRLHEDEAVIHEILVRCERIVLTDAKLYYYRKRENSIMGQDSDKSIKDAVYAYQRRISFFAEHNMPIDEAQAQRNLLLYLREQYDSAKAMKDNKGRLKFVREELGKSIKSNRAFCQVLDKASILEIYILNYIPGILESYRILLKWLVDSKRRIQKL